MTIPVSEEWRALKHDFSLRTKDDEKFGGRVITVRAPLWSSQISVPDSEFLRDPDRLLQEVISGAVRQISHNVLSNPAIAEEAEYRIRRVVDEIHRSILDVLRETKADSRTFYEIEEVFREAR